MLKFRRRLERQIDKRWCVCHFFSRMKTIPGVIFLFELRVKLLVIILWQKIRRVFHSDAVMSVYLERGEPWTLQRLSRLRIFSYSFHSKISSSNWISLSCFFCVFLSYLKNITRIIGTILLFDTVILVVSRMRVANDSLSRDLGQHLVAIISNQSSISYSAGTAAFFSTWYVTTTAFWAPLPVAILKLKLILLLLKLLWQARTKILSLRKAL